MFLVPDACEASGNSKMRDFLIPDSSSERHAECCAAPAGPQHRHTIIRACAIRQSGVEKHAKILRFYYNLPTNIANALNKWEVGPRHGYVDPALSAMGAQMEMRSVVGGTPILLLGTPIQKSQRRD